MLTWIQNMGDPELPDAEALVVESQGQAAWDERVAFLEGKIIGKPRAYALHSVTRLHAMGMVGIYEKQADPVPCQCGRGDTFYRKEGCGVRIMCRNCRAYGALKWNKADAVAIWNEEREA